MIDHSRWTVLLLLIAESYTSMLILLAHRAVQRDVSPVAMVATVYATCAVALLNGPGNTAARARVDRRRPATGQHGVAVHGKGLPRSLVRPAAGPARPRDGGPYRLVRHPIYFGYLIGHVGFLLANFSWRNATVLACCTSRR
jgi:hypothetical protein